MIFPPGEHYNILDIKIQLRVLEIMSSFLVIAIAVFLDRLFGQPTKYQPMQWFVKMATFIEQSWLGQEELIVTKDTTGKQLIEALVKLKGTLAMLFLVLPFLAVALYVKQFAFINFIFGVLVLYLGIGARDLKQHALVVHKDLIENNIEQARKELTALTNHSTSDMNQQDILLDCLQSVFKKGNSALIAPIFWFVVLGAPGVVLYRLVDTLAVMWNCQNNRYRNFGKAANQVDTAIGIIPACMTAFSYVLLGELATGWQCLIHHGLRLGPAVAAGAGALNVEIGGEIHYQGQTLQIPKLGLGQAPQSSDIVRACGLIERSMILWLAIIFVLSLTHC
jgi:adenosylcobinamide-phosphate synthase